MKVFVCCVFSKSNKSNSTSKEFKNMNDAIDWGESYMVTSDDDFVVDSYEAPVGYWDLPVYRRK